MASKKRIVRLTVGIILVFILIISIVPKFYLHTSTDGVISARTITLTSPIEGVLNFPEKVQHGKYFKKGHIIGTVRHDRIDLSFLHKLITEQKTLEGRIKSFKKRIERYKALNIELKENLEKYQKFSAEKLRFMITQDENKLKHERAEYDRAKKELIANRHLEKKKAVRRRDLEASEANFVKASHKMMQIREHVKELKKYQKAVAEGTFFGGGNDDSPYSEQRMHQLVIEIS